MDDVTKAGSDVGGFLSGILNPLFGSSTTTTTQTGDVSATSKANSGMGSTTKYIMIAVGVIILGTVAFLLIRKKKP
jgi:LPXTG-motif cell wall-anchored protein